MQLSVTSRSTPAGSFVDVAGSPVGRTVSGLLGQTTLFLTLMAGYLVGRAMADGHVTVVKLPRSDRGSCVLS